MKRPYCDTSADALPKIESIIFCGAQLEAAGKREYDYLVMDKPRTNNDRQAAVSEMEKVLRQACTAVAHLSSTYDLRRDGSGPTDDSVVVLRETRKEVLVGTPLAATVKPGRGTIPAGEAMDYVTLATPTCWRGRVGKLGAYVLAVYKMDRKKALPDGDNLRDKALIDAACRRVGAEDTCERVTVVVYGIRSATIPEGMYLLLTPLRWRPLSQRAVVRRVTRLLRA